MAKQSAPTRPLIGLNMDFVPAGKMAGAQLRLHAGYAESVYAAGGMPIFIPPVCKDHELNGLLDRLDGFLLAGGPLDMDPKRQNLEPHPAVQPMPAKREDFDRTLCKYISERKLPVLAVALGMQELNVTCGGTLFQHLPEDMPKALPHKDLTGGPHRHAVNLVPKTLLDKIYGGGEIRVNSYHHQSVKQVAPKFQVSALSLDGVIEAYESIDPNWFCIGVQWHPHSETASALDMQLFESFVSNCAGKGIAGLRLAA
jgi:putative glutamine amidotransferase